MVVGATTHHGRRANYGTSNAARGQTPKRGKRAAQSLPAQNPGKAVSWAGGGEGFIQHPPSAKPKRVLRRAETLLAAFWSPPDVDHDGGRSYQAHQSSWEFDLGLTDELRSLLVFEVELVSTLRAHRNGLVRADLMGRLLGMWDPIPSHGSDLFLAALSALSAASKEKGIHPSPPLAGAGRPSLGPTMAKGEKGRKGGAPPEDAKERDAAYCSLEVAREMLPAPARCR